MLNQRPDYFLTLEAGHNACTLLFICLVTSWAYSLYVRVNSLRSAFIYQKTSKPVVLPGVSHASDELSNLMRPHLEQIIATVDQLRSPPVAPKELQLLAHVETDGVKLVRCEGCDNIPSGVHSHVSMALHATHAAKVSACMHFPWSAFESLDPKVLLANSMSKDSVSGQQISVPVVSSGESSNDAIPLMIVVGSLSLLEASICRVSGERVDVVRQILVGKELEGPYQLCGLYGFEESVSPECMICYDRRVDTILLPCCHCSLCGSCAENLRDGRCPICRGVYLSYVTLPVSEQRSTPHHTSLSATVTTPLLG